MDAGLDRRVISSAPAAFDQACQRWRELYTLAADEKSAAHALNSDATVSPQKREEARRRYQEASRRVELLLNESDAAGQSDFYTYRYLASEGFLPGYSFPRLPLSAFIPGTRGEDSAWLQRARFLAITEFGPGALIYHEGATYQVSRIALPRRGDGARRRRGRPHRGPGVLRLRLPPPPSGRGRRVRELRCSAGRVWHDLLQLQRSSPGAGSGSAPTRRNATGSGSSCARPTGSPRSTPTPAPMPSSATTVIATFWTSPTATPPRSA